MIYLMDKFHLKTEECLMVGNDVGEDISQYSHDGFVHLDTYLKGIIL